MNDAIDLSIVVPVLNEEASIGPLLREIISLRDSGDLPREVEVIAVDDGSTDQTLAILRDFSEREPDLIFATQLNRTFGQTHALNVGFRLSKGRYVIAIDGDGQNDPSDIPRLLSEIERLGVDCVSGWRQNRLGDGRMRVLVSRVANRLLQKASRVQINDSGCTLKAYRGEVIRSIPLYGDMHRLIPFQIELAGGRVSELVVNHRARFGGQSKYGFRRVFRVLQDVIVSFFLRNFYLRPMHLLGTVGTGVLTLGLSGISLALILKVLDIFALVETPILLFGLILTIGGLNIIGLGLLAELNLRQTLSQEGRIYPLAQTKSGK